MKITIENTSKLVFVDGVQTRLWEGTTESGVPVHLFVARVAIPIETPPEKSAEFERELSETRVPSAAVAAYPLHLIL